MEENLKKKKNTLKTKLVIIIFLAIMILSCSENNPTEPSSNGYWKQYLFEDPYNNFVTNGLAIDNQFYCTGMNGISMFTDFETNPQMKYIWYISTGYDSKPIISKKYTAFFKESSETNIGFSNYITQDGNVTSVSPASFGEQFKDYKFSFITTKREFGAINNQNRFVTTISNRSGMVADTTYIVYADFDFNDGISISNTGFWEIPSMISTPINEKAFKSYNGKFYISYSREFSPNNYFIEISENGEINKELIPVFINKSYQPEVLYDNNAKNLLSKIDMLSLDLINGDLLNMDEKEYEIEAKLCWAMHHKSYKKHFLKNIYKYRLGSRMPLILNSIKNKNIFEKRGSK